MLSPRLLLCVAVLLAFGSSITHGFHFDDFAVLNGPHWTAWQTRPLTWLTFELNSLGGTHPALWHAVNLAVHVVCVLALYQLLSEIDPAIAFVSAALFAVHPIQAEAVAYVYARATLISTMFSLGSLLLWIREHRWWAVVCFAAALLGKEDAVTLPLALLLIMEWDPWRSASKRIAARTAAPIATMLALSLTLGIRTLLATQHTAGSGAGFSSPVGWTHYLLEQGPVILRYLRLLFIPYGFTIDPSIQFSAAACAAAWLLLALIVFVVTRTPAAKWVLAGLILLIPSSSVFPAADLAADHRMYLPMIAFAPAIGTALIRLPKLAPLAAVIALILVSAERMSVWASDEALWTEAMRRAPEKLRPQLQLARTLPPKQALTLLQRAEATHPANPEVEAELGRTYLALGDPQSALQQFGLVLAQKPEDATAVNNRGVALRALGQSEVAEQDFRRALKLEPCMVEARRNLGWKPCSR